MSLSEQEKLEDVFCAPVIIPTLCRFDHFKQCIESLSHCVWADKTDVFVGLDYPAKDSHWDGYNKIKNYLKTATLGFKSLNVIEREKNYGFGPNGNLSALKKQVFEQFDCLIESEDDNIFSPNFLVFINKGLKAFKNDKSVFAINGYRHFYPIKKAQNTFFRQSGEFSAWGFGIWRDRLENLPPVEEFFSHFSLKKFFDIRKNIGENRALNYWSYYFYPQRTWIDVSMSIYIYLNNMDVIMPAEKSLVRNIGWDGSGEHCAGKDDLAQKHLNQQISDEVDFEFKGTGFEFYKENRAIYKKSSYAKFSRYRFWKRFCKYFLKYLMKKLSLK
ncbi:glycosyl transferase [Fibrobacter succinogenes]|uniref:Uncharacterized protein n=1 Tax=Fibrobacter succinogenes TaxID=833 RepID=A0A380S8Z5_FIBSU|nr:glycosyl transferase [Fibrobacter succinogenes]PWJ34848.1 hypothetical protein IE02_2385 [Fibrobacter succinogenes subsp. elongatus]SUQ24971.1 hypothetical protein SAMN05661053_2385 [Fibrobacter succinogenes]